ncbi:substrate-binding periplasmic protein [Catenovulum sediminis]|uniref:ABC transporter substrate-binding protein n=1 Tax=Catenovulum sediminis TaxID=1740262 RepID=A0ABV1RGE1_9ALTE|nr:ABC transporter substrate-binding protein [Catenovulum sediminis]
MDKSLLFLVLCCVLQFNTAQAENIYYPPPLSEWDKRQNYPIRLLGRALALSDPSLKLTQFAEQVGQDKALNMLNSGQIDVVWTMTNKQREALYLPIRIPIVKGLSGWRLLLIKDEHQRIFDTIGSVNQLSLFKAVQGESWPDTQILRANQLRVISYEGYDQLFEILINGEAQYFPRSVFEIWEEALTYSKQGIAIEKNLVLQYPTALYFFVNSREDVLAKKIEQGLNMMRENGEFDDLFMHTFGPAILKANLLQRTVIRLENPSLPKETPLQDKTLWYQPNMDRW